MLYKAIDIFIYIPTQMLSQVIRYTILIALFAMLSSCTTTFYLVRHAEKANSTPDTPLSAAGHARAEALRDTLISKNIKQIFVTNYLRTQQTAAPLATQLGITPTEIPGNQTEQLVQQLKAIKGKNVLVVGHSNTVPVIISGLMESPQNVTITETDFDNLFKVKITKGGDRIIEFVELTYGEP